MENWPTVQEAPEVAGTVTTYVPTTVGSMAMVEVPALSTTCIPKPAAKILVLNKARKSVFPELLKLPLVTVQLYNGMEPAGKEFTFAAYVQPVHVTATELPAVNVPEGSM